MKYSFESYVRYSEIGEDRNLTLNSVINYFQDCSTFQSEHTGVGIEYLQEKNRVWVLSSWQIVVDRYPKLCEKIKITTWPYAFKRFLGSRNFTMEDESGATVAYANSLWTYGDWYPEYESFPVRPHHLDTNHHVNNGEYVAMAEEFVPAGFCVHQMRAEYKGQAVLGDIIVPKVKQEQGVCTVALCSENGEPYAVVELKEKKEWN